jgi:hypothetical protein
MSCCGQKRDAVAAEGRPTNFVTHSYGPSRVVPGGRGLAAGAASPAPDRNFTVTIRCRDRSALIVRGSTTGKRYQFSGGGSMQAVDRRDAEALVATGLFERIWG